MKELAEIPVEGDASGSRPSEVREPAPDSGNQSPPPDQNFRLEGGHPLPPPSVTTSEAEKTIKIPSPPQSTTVTPFPPESPSGDWGVLRAQLLDAAKARLPEIPEHRMIDLTSPHLANLQQILPEIQTVLTEGLDPLQKLTDLLTQGTEKLREVRF